MDEQSFDGIARRFGRLRTRRYALKNSGCGAAAVFADFRLVNSALAQVTTEDLCTGTVMRKEQEELRLLEEEEARDRL